MKMNLQFRLLFKSISARKKKVDSVGFSNLILYMYMKRKAVASNSPSGIVWN